MKRIIFLILTIVLLAFFLAGCSVPNMKALPDEHGRGSFPSITSSGRCEGTPSGDLPGWYYIRQIKTNSFLVDDELYSFSLLYLYHGDTIDNRDNILT